ncbi:hypothetical protein HPB50_025803 [Hyalomma asiaticum]|uniref:Uncharacterized protein n=1 Tax=Hyalomma asiaticum TaxID=266040 RepID=A0ACB7SPN0_HYAAI|nr:hypothetical protein HPB50_025803 [Hyalomma asiaticum]
MVPVTCVTAATGSVVRASRPAKYVRREATNDFQMYQDSSTSHALTTSKTRHRSNEQVAARSAIEPTSSYTLAGRHIAATRADNRNGSMVHSVREHCSNTSRLEQQSKQRNDNLEDGIEVSKMNKASVLRPDIQSPVHVKWML